MFKHQHFIDVQEDNGSIGESKSWVSVSGEEEDESSQSSFSNGIGSSNVDGELFNNLVEIVPLVESLMDRRPKTSFTRRAHVICTKTPSKEPDDKKITDLKGTKSAAKTIPPKKHRDCLCDERNKSENVKNYELSTFKSRASASIKLKDRKELIKLEEQVENLQKRLLEKDELLKSAQVSMKEMAALHADVDEMKKQVIEKNSLIESTHVKLSDAKVELADKQSILESLEFEAMTSNKKVKMLEKDLESMQREISAFTMLLEVFKENNSTSYVAVSDTIPILDQIPHIDDIDEIKMQQMEEIRKAYIAAVTTAKEKQDEESVVLAAKMRFRLQSLVLVPKNANLNDGIYAFPAFPLDMVVS